MQEDTQDVLLNLKKLAVNVPSGEPTVTRLEATGPKAGHRRRRVGGERGRGAEPGDPHRHPGGGRHPRRSSSGSASGRGYVARPTGIPRGTVPAGAIAMDAAFSPIQRVSYSVENARLGKVTDYEKLILEIWTNGAVSPDEALTRAARHLRITSPYLAPEGREEEDEEVEATGEGFLQESLSKPLEELPLPARAINALKNHEILTVADLVQKTDEDLENVKNLGSKSIDEIKTALAGARAVARACASTRTCSGALGRGGAK